MEGKSLIENLIVARAERKRERSMSYLNRIVSQIDDMQETGETEEQLHLTTAESIKALYSCYKVSNPKTKLSELISEKDATSIMNLWIRNAETSGSYRVVTDESFRIARKKGQPLRPVRFVADVINTHPDLFTQSFRRQLAKDFAISWPHADWGHSIPTQTAKNINYILGVKREGDNDLVKELFGKVQISEVKP